jgi:hypothetical protein
VRATFVLRLKEVECRGGNDLQAVEKQFSTQCVAIIAIEVSDDNKRPLRMLKKDVQQGRSERRGEAYFVPYVEPLSNARTPLADFFSILPGD